MNTSNDSGCKNVTGTISRREALKLGGTLLIGATLPGCVSHLTPTTVTVGNPAQPAALPSAIIDAYNQGARDITIRPGAYLLPATGKNCIELAGWKNAVLRFKNCTIIFEEIRHRPVLFCGCSNVTIEDATLQFAGISYTQGRIKAIGEDSDGKYLDWQIDAGYPTNRMGGSEELPTIGWVGNEMIYDCCNKFCCIRWDVDPLDQVGKWCCVVCRDKSDAASGVVAADQCGVHFTVTMPLVRTNNSSN